MPYELGEQRLVVAAEERRGRSDPDAAVATADVGDEDLDRLGDGGAAVVSQEAQDLAGGPTAAQRPADAGRRQAVDGRPAAGFDVGEAAEPAGDAGIERAQRQDRQVRLHDEPGLLRRQGGCGRVPSAVVVAGQLAAHGGRQPAHGGGTQERRLLEEPGGRDVGAFGCADPEVRCDPHQVGDEDLPLDRVPGRHGRQRLEEATSLAHDVEGPDRPGERRDRTALVAFGGGRAQVAASGQPGPQHMEPAVDDVQFEPGGGQLAWPQLAACAADEIGRGGQFDERGGVVFAQPAASGQPPQGPHAEAPRLEQRRGLALEGVAETREEVDHPAGRRSRLAGGVDAGAVRDRRERRWTGRDVGEGDPAPPQQPDLRDQLGRAPRRLHQQAPLQQPVDGLIPGIEVGRGRPPKPNEP